MITTFQRRHFMLGAAAATTLAATGFHTTELFGKTIKHKPLDPVNPDILFGTTGSIWGEAGIGATKVYSTEQAVKHISQMGLQGIEPYTNQIEDHRAKPLELKKRFDAAGITLIDVSNGARGQSTNFIDPAQTPKTISDHVAFARDFLQPFGCNVWKCNMGARPAGGHLRRRSQEDPLPARRGRGEPPGEQPEPARLAPEGDHRMSRRPDPRGGNVRSEEEVARGRKRDAG